MYRLPLLWLSLLLAALIACQPIRPESELTPVAPESATTAITETAPITGTATITTSGEITPSSEITSTSEMTATTTRAESGQAAPAPAPSDTRPTETVAAATSCPAIVDESLDLIIEADWEEGEQRTYLVTQSQSEVTEGDEAVALAVTTPITITVLAVEDDGYTLRWDFGEAEFGETEIEMPDPLQSLMQTPLDVVFEYATDETGAYIELLNLEELQEQIDPLVDQIFDAMIEADPTMDEETIEAARGMVENIFGDSANFDALFTREVQLFHTLYGFYFESVEPMVLPDVRPNMLGGPPIPSELTVIPTNYDAELGCLHVEFENVADPVEARNSILESLQEQARQMGVPGPDEEDLPSTLELVDNIRFEMDLENGWPIAIYLERVTSFGPQGRLDTTEIVLVEPGSE